MTQNSPKKRRMQNTSPSSSRCNDQSKIFRLVVFNKVSTSPRNLIDLNDIYFCRLCASMSQGTTIQHTSKERPSEQHRRGPTRRNDYDGIDKSAHPNKCEYAIDV
jgi:hypothetical protein